MQLYKDYEQKFKAAFKKSFIRIAIHLEIDNAFRNKKNQSSQKIVLSVRFNCKR